MALIVETGQALADADSYCSLVTADSYHQAYGNDAWADLDTAEKEIRLRQATLYLRAYSEAWKGVKAYEHQKLDWPRFNASAYGYVIPNNRIPFEVVEATALLALKAIDGPLAPDLDQAVLSEKVGSIEVTYDNRSPQPTRYRDVDLMLAPLLGGSSNVLKLVRA